MQINQTDGVVIGYQGMTKTAYTNIKKINILVLNYRSECNFGDNTTLHKSQL